MFRQYTTTVRHRPGHTANRGAISMYSRPSRLSMPPQLGTVVGNPNPRTTALKDGTITSPMLDLEHVEVSPVPMIFRRMVRGLEFDVAEMTLATCFCARAHGKRFTGIPIFLTRAFYHGELLCHRRSGIRAPKDLEGRKVGVRSYTFTPGVWTRGILAAEYDVDLDAVTWVLSGDEHVQEYVAPANVVSSPHNDLATMLLAGEIDAAIAPGPVDAPDIQPLFPDARQADDAWHRKTGIYPISHLLVVKDAALTSHRGLATELFRLFSEARSQYLPRLRSGAADDPRIGRCGRWRRRSAAPPFPTASRVHAGLWKPSFASTSSRA